MRPLLITLLLALALALGAGLATPALGQGGADPAPAATTERQATTAPAAEPAPSENESLPIPEGSSGPVSVDGGMGGTALRLFLGLLVVVALIVGVWQVMKRVQRNRYPALAVGGGAGELIDVVATTPLGPNRALHLVRVGDAVVLVGATEQAVQAITTLDEASAAIIARALGPGGPGEGDRARAAQTARGAGVPITLMDRVRAMTVRR